MQAIPRWASRSKSSRILAFFLFFYLPHQSRRHFACISKRAQTRAKEKKRREISKKKRKKQGESKETNTLISEYCTNSIITMPIAVPLFLPVNHMNYNCFMNISRVRGASLEAEVQPASISRPSDLNEPPPHLYPRRSPTPIRSTATCFLFPPLIQRANTAPLERLMRL